jgi:hypothetical protein
MVTLLDAGERKGLGGLAVRVSLLVCIGPAGVRNGGGDGFGYAGGLSIRRHHEEHGGGQCASERR